MPELWVINFPVPGAAADFATRAEALGWDGLVFADTQNITGDPYSALCLSAHRTEKLKLGVGVTNPVTRHPAVTASAIHTVQVESGGRALLGIGRGDSSLAHLGMRPAPVRELVTYVERVQRFLSGDVVDLDGVPSENMWIRHTNLPKVPVDVAATGPKVIAAAARLADGVTFSVGADLDRLRWAIDVARSARADHGLAGAPFSMGAWVTVVSHPDVDRARQLARGGMGIFAHFAGMPGGHQEHLDDEERAIADRLGAEYDLANHGRADASHASLLTDDFVDRFGIVGPVEHCVERLVAIADLGFDRLVVVPGSRDLDPEISKDLFLRLSLEVLPEVRQRLGGRTPSSELTPTR